MPLFGGKFVPSFMVKRQQIASGGGNKFRVGPRLAIEASNKLGLKAFAGFPHQSIRVPELEVLDSYYEGRQYVHLPPWDSSSDPQAPYIPVRQRSPRLKLAFAKVMAERVSAKLVGTQTFPAFKVDQDPDMEEYLRFVIKSSKIKSRILEPTRRMLAAGSVFIRFKIVDGTYKIEHFLSKFTHPKFNDGGELESVEIRFVFEDPNEKDSDGNPKKKWFRMILTQNIDIRYQPADFKESEQDPDFEGDPRFNQIEEEVLHGLGFVQGEWMRTVELPDTVDGIPIIGDILGFIDELNYNLSQSSTAIQYNQDPQLILKGMNQEEVDELIRSSVKAWNLGREGEGKFLETTLTGVKAAAEFRENIRLNVGDVSRVILMDPEKMVAHAQSAKAMEVLHAPMIDLVNEIRPTMESSLISLIMKMAIANLILTQRGEDAPVTIPPGFKPKSLDIVVSWPPIFAMTMQDLLQKVQVATSASTGNIISRRSATQFVAKDFGIEDIQVELDEIASQPVINPFGGF